MSLISPRTTDEDELEKDDSVSSLLVGAYKTYNQSDYYELVTLHDCLSDHNKPVPIIDLESSLAVYCGIPIFALQVNANLF